MEDIPMTDMLKRDITGKCEGECRDRVSEGEAERQAELNKSGPDYAGETSSVPWANSRSEQPGVYGGHV